MKNNCSKYLGVVTSAGASDEHPMSTRSASDGRRWHSRGMQLICTLVLLFTFAIGNVWAKEVTFTAGSNTAITKKASTSSPLLYMVRGGGGATYTSDYGIQLKTDLVFVFTIDATTDLTINLKSKDTNNAGRDNKFKLYSLNSKKTGFLKILEYSVTNNAKLDASYNALKSDADVVAFSASSISNGNYCSIDNNPAVGSLIGSELTLHTDKNSPKSGGYSSLSAGTYILFCTAAPTTNVCMYSMTFTSKTNPTITFNDGAYSVGSAALDLSSLFSSNSDGAVTYTVKTDGSTNASISGTNFTATAAGTAVVTASQAATSTYNAATKDANIVVTVPSTPTHGITYNNTKGATNPNPDTYYEGTGVASFEPLADVTDFHFNGWSPALISADATTDQTITAQWVSTYNVSFDKGAGSGTAPDGFQKWEGAKFNLPGQGEMVAPSGKAFDGWKANGSGDKLAAGSEYTMGGEAVEFVAQWKNLPTTIFHYQWTGSSTAPTANSALTATGGTFTFYKSPSSSKDFTTASVTYHTGVSSDMKTVAGTSDKLVALNSTSNNSYLVTLTGNKYFEEGDTVFFAGYGNFRVGTTHGADDIVAASSALETGSGASDVNVGYFIFPELENNVNTLYFTRDATSGNRGFTAVKVIRPAQKDVKSTVYDLTAVKINGTAISAADLATLKTGEAYLLDLATEYPVGPTVKFARKTTITYEDDSQKVTNDTITVTATEVSSKWQVQATIGTIKYTVKMAQVTAATVSYYDGATKLGEEVVAINGNPADYADYQSKDLSSFVGWYDNSGLTGDAVTIASATITKDTTFYGKWNPVYAQSANLEQWVLTNGTSYDAVAQLGTLHYASNIANSLDSLNDDPSKTNRNYAYLGLKIKSGGKMLDFRLANGQTVKVKFGATGNYPQVALNGGSYGAMSLTDNVWTYTADADAYISIKTANDNTVVIKQIMIGADPAIAEVTLPWRVTYNANGGTCATAEAIWSGSALILPDVTPEVPADYTFAGWYDGDDLAGAAGANYTATKNVTLQAHFAPVEYAIAYDGNDATSGSMSAGAAGWGTLVTPATNAFEKTGHVFSGWEITKTSDGSATGITFSEGKFEMPKYDVTLVAQWTDVSKVAVIVETNVKYESLTEAIAAATDGQTIQLIQDITQEEAILIDKNLTLDLNNKTFTVTNPSSEYSNRAIKVTAGTIVIKNGTVDALSNETHNGGCWGSLRQEGGHLTCNNVTFKNYRSGGLGLKPVGGTLILNECTVLSEIGGGLELGNATVEVNNCTFTQTGTDANKIYGACFGMGKMGTLTINGGTYTSDNYSFYIYTSGGTINVNSGTFAGDVKTEMNNTQYPSAVGTINISGGTFDGVGENPIVFTAVTANDHISISGGVFDAPIENQYCAEGYVPQDNGDNTYGVTPKDGVCIIKATTNNEVTGLIGGTIDQSFSGNADSRKLNKSTYFGVTLANSETFQEGDVMVVNITTAADLGQFMVYADAARTQLVADQGIVYTKADPSSTGEMSITLPAAANGKTSLYLSREDGDTQWNVTFSYIEVKRPMKPVLTAITINSVDADIDEANKTVAITLPEATTDLAALTVVPTIVWNEAAATNSIVVNNGAAWQEGANTYKLTDKDGDATTYTITITLQGEAPAPVIETQPATQAYCAGSEPTLSVTASVTEGTLHYAWFKEAGADDEAVGEDQATYTIASAGTYYVIVTNKVDGKLDASTTSNNAVITLNTAAAITTQPTAYNDVVSGTQITLSVTATNATGYQWYICDDAEKHNASAISGAESASYVFNCTASAYYYCVVGNACGDDLESNVVSVKLEPEGCNLVGTPSGNAYTKAGEWSIYPVNSSGQHDPEGTDFGTCKAFDEETDVNCVNTRRFAIKFEKDVESVTIYARGGTGRTFDKVSVADEMAKNAYTELIDITKQLITIDGAGKEYIATAEGMIPGGKYAWFDFSGSFSGVFKICYTEAIEKPVIATQPATKIDFAAGDMTATVVVNAVTEGTLKYQWYNADGDVAIEGATSATLTTTTEGTYYVIVRNTLAGHKDYAVKSEEATLAYRQENDATLSALSVSAGTLDPAFNKNVIEYRVDLPKGTTTVPTLTATATMAAYGATAVKTEATEFENYEAVSTVLVTAEDHTTQKTYTVHYYVAHTVAALVDVTENTTWDWSLVTKKADGTTISGDGPKLNENEDGLILASYLSGDDFDKLEGNNGAYAIRNGSDKKVYQGASLRMHITKGGYLSIWAANEGHSMTLNVANAGRDMQIATLTSDQVEYKLYVQAGDVRIYNVSSESKPMRVSKIVFTVDETPDYTRNVSNNIGTLCVDHNVLAGGALGATFYQIASRNEEYDYKIDFEEVLPGEELKAGEPYIFQSTTGRIDLFFGETEAPQPVAVRGMIGNYDAGTLAITEENQHTILYIAQNKLWTCGNLVGQNLILNEHRAYINMELVPTYAEYTAVQNPAPGRRRVTLGRDAEQTATGIDAINASEKPMKIMIEGQIYILRGEKVFDATGRLVK